MAQTNKEQNLRRKNTFHGSPEQELKWILEAYPSLSVSDVTLFTKVYYPIAQVEVEMLERSFEDFETIQKTVMRLMELGVTDPRTIAQTLSLTPAYIDGMINRFLAGRGLVENGALTELGREALKTDTLLAQVTVRELFHIDALSGRLLRLPELISEEKLRMRSNTDIAVGHLNLIDGVPSSVLTDQLRANQPGTYLPGKSRSKLLEIRRIEFKELKYAESYMIGLKGSTRPVIFAKRSPDPEDENDRYGRWLPFSVENKQQRALLGADDDVPYTSDRARRYIDSILEQLDNAAASVRRNQPERSAEHTIRTYMSDKYRIDLDRLSPPRIQGRLRTYTLTQDAFIGFNRLTLSLLADLGRQDRVLITAPRFYGITLSITAQDKDILRAAQTLDQRLSSAKKRGELLNSLCDLLTDSPDPFGEIQKLSNGAEDKV